MSINLVPAKTWINNQIESLTGDPLSGFDLITLFRGGAIQGKEGIKFCHLATLLLLSVEFFSSFLCHLCTPALSLFEGDNRRKRMDRSQSISFFPPLKESVSLSTTWQFLQEVEAWLKNLGDFAHRFKDHCYHVSCKTPMKEWQTDSDCRQNV